MTLLLEVELDPTENKRCSRWIGPPTETGVECQFQLKPVKGQLFYKI